jgi:hypothetical protein
MSENLSIPHPKEYLLSQLDQIEQEYADVIDKIKDEQNETVPKEVPLKFKVGKEDREDTYTTYPPLKHYFFKPELTAEERIAHLLFWAQKLAFSESELLVPKNKIRALLEGKKSKIERRDLRLLAIEMNNAAAELNAFHPGSYREEPRVYIGLQAFLGSLIPRFSNESSPNYEIHPSRWGKFISAVGKAVHEVLKSGMSAAEAVELLQQKDYLFSLVGADREYTEADSL